MDPIYEAYTGVITEAKLSGKERNAVVDVVGALKDYKKSSSKLDALEKAISDTGEPNMNFKFPDAVETDLEVLGHRFFGPPNVYDNKWDGELDAVLRNLSKVI